MNDTKKTIYRALKRAQKQLKKSGFDLTFSAKHIGINQLCVLNEHEIRLIFLKSVESGKITQCIQERAMIAKIKLPRNVQKELWVWEENAGFHYFAVGNRS